MTSSENAPYNLGFSALASHVTACRSADPHILREQISQQLDELAVKEKDLLDTISRKRLELNRLWNASLPINRLPNELLVQIFTHFPDVPFSSSKPPPWWFSSHEYVSGRTGWHRLMLVCLHWRTVFLSTPTFWREIDLERHVKWTNLCLTRSATASIDVRALGKTMIVIPIELLPPHVHRFKTLRLYTPYNPQWKMAPGLLLDSLGDMPLLEELLLEGPRGPRPRGPPFRANITLQRFPSLRNLALRETVVPADVSLFSRLQKLTLSFCPYDFAFDVFLNILAASVQLEDLTLYGALSYPSDEWLRSDLAEPSTVPPPISLPRLHKLTMEHHTIVQTSRFLAHMYLPPTISLLAIGDYEAELGPFNAMLPPNRSTTLPILAIVTSVEMTVEGDDYCLACGALPPAVSTHKGPPSDASWLHAAFALQRNDYEDWDTFMAQGLQDLVESLGRSPLTQLTVTGDHDYASADAWESVFRTFPTLEELEIGGDSYSDVTNVFRGLHAASTARAADSPVACRNLKHIKVKGLGEVETYATMERCFWYRGDKGVLLEVLDLKHLRNAVGLTPKMRDALVKSLSKVVKCVQMSDDDEHNDEDSSDGSET